MIGAVVLLGVLLAGWVGGELLWHWDTRRTRR